jgi:hypothetical protein
MEANLRLKTTRQALRADATQDENANERLSSTLVKHLTKKVDYMFNFDLQDGFYTLGINLAKRDYFAVNVRGQLYRLEGLPKG